MSYIWKANGQKEKFRMLAALVGIGFLLLTVMGLFYVRQPHAELPAAYVPKADGKPPRLPTLVQPLFGFNSSESHLVDQVLSHPRMVPLSCPVLCHIIRLYGLGPVPRSDLKCGADAIQVLTNDDMAFRAFGCSILVRTRQGARYRCIQLDGSSYLQAENHRDVCLATFAAVGLPLSTPLKIAEDGPLSLHDLLTDSVAHFDLTQQEIAWTAIAYGLYLYPQRSWRNREGASFTFDDLANELMRRPLKNASCDGVHVLEALTTLLRLNRLGAETSLNTHRYLENVVRRAVASQSEDGYWMPGWYESGPTSGTSDRESLRLFSTGHLVEWMESLPADIQPSEHVYRKAASWLCTMLAKVPDSLTGEEQCLWTHAVCSVRNLTATKDVSLKSEVVASCHSVIGQLGCGPGWLRGSIGFPVKRR